MTAVNLSGSFKRDERPFNGIEAIAEELLDEKLGHESYFVVAEIKPHTYVYHADDGSKIPTVRFTHIEVVHTDDDEKAVKALLNRYYTERTGGEMPATLFDDQDPADID